MSVKKLLVLTAAGLAVVGASAAMAGGPDHMAMPTAAVAPAFQNSVYVDLHGGYAQSNWTDSNSNRVMGTSATSIFSPTKNGKGSWTGGVDLGYNFTPNIALEGGWLYLPKVTGAATAYGIAQGGTPALTSASTATVKSWMAYAAAKFTVPVMTDISLFGKIGAAYRSLKYGVPSNTVLAATNTTGNGHYWAPVFGAGLQYEFANWLAGAQYLYLPGNSSVNDGAVSPLQGAGAPDAAPQVNLYTVFLGYKFNV